MVLKSTQWDGAARGEPWAGYCCPIKAEVEELDTEEEANGTADAASALEVEFNVLKGIACGGEKCVYTEAGGGP